jgi:hypothetical protein
MHQEIPPMSPSNEGHLTPDDISHLKTLALAHYILGGLGVFLSLFALIHVFLGLAIVTGATDMQDAPPFVGWLFLCMGLTFLVLGEAASIAMILSARHMKRRTGWVFSFVVACISCMSVPVGTILGILTIIVLNRDSVKAAYGRQ